MFQVVFVFFFLFLVCLIIIMSLYAGQVIHLTGDVRHRADHLRVCLGSCLAALHLPRQVQGATITDIESQANIIIVCAPSEFPLHAVIGAHLEPNQDETPLQALLRRHERWKKRAGVGIGQVVVLREEWLGLCEKRGKVVGREEQYGGWEVL
jgi:hypothetical protein